MHARLRHVSPSVLPRAVVLAAFALLATACSEAGVTNPDGLLGVACGSNGDCAKLGDWYCAPGGVCLPNRCSSDAECVGLGNLVCSAQTHRCVPVDQPCGGVCEIDEICVLASCRKRCNDQVPCPLGQACDLFRGACMDYHPSDDLPDLDTIDLGDDDPATGDGDDDSDGTESTDPEEREPERELPEGGEYHDQGEACTASIECAPGLVCIAVAGRKTCQPECDPFGAPCAGGRFCHLAVTLDESDSYRSGRGACLEDNGGSDVDGPCWGENVCRPDLHCVGHDICAKVCPAAANGEPAPVCGGRLCTTDETKTDGIGTGVCQKCTVAGMICPEGKVCNQTSGACETPPEADCRDAGHECLLPQVCLQIDGFYQCSDGCQITGCPSGFCNRATGLCENVCVPACPSGQCCNQENRCGSCCVPECQPGFYCDGAGGTPTCQEIRDCRLSTAPNNGCRTGTGCNPATDPTCFPEQCDQNTGLCTRRCPTSCPPGQFCDDARTQFQCRTPNSNECSPQNPTGNCPSAGDECRNGLCVPTGPIGGCVQSGDPVTFGEQCCGNKVVCGSAISLLIGTAVCCSTDQAPLCFTIPIPLFGDILGATCLAP